MINRLLILTLCVALIACAGCRTSKISYEKQEGQDYVRASFEGPAKDFPGGFAASYGDFEVSAGEAITTGDPTADVIKALMGPESVLSQALCIANPATCQPLQ